MDNDYAPLPRPWDAKARAVARQLLQDCVYGEIVVPHSVVFENWETVAPGVSLADSPFPMLLSLPKSDKRVPAIAALSFLPVQESVKAADVWPIDLLTESGWAVALACMNDIEPDDPTKSSGTAIAKWAMGLMKMRMWLASDSRIDASRILALGHSRLGKAALVASAFDEEFAGTVAIQSGCGGAAPSRTSVGETIKDITRIFPHWFSPKFASYAGREHELPLDQHWLLALCASRPLLLCNASDDVWANPEGQHAMLSLASEAFGETLPPLSIQNTVGSRLAHFYREGTHQVTWEDWQAILRWLADV